MQREAFLTWAASTSQKTLLWNQYEVIWWNTQKRYLSELGEMGTPIIPTVWLSAGTRVDIGQVLAIHEWNEAVIKPVIGTNAYGATRISSTSLAEGQRLLDTLLGKRDVMLQPFLPSVDGYGERSLVFIDGVFTHAFRKQPAFSDQDLQGERQVFPTPDELDLAERILQNAWRRIYKTGKHGFLFARVDLVRDQAGDSCLMELELTEPRLRLDLSPMARERLVQAIKEKSSAKKLATVACAQK